MLIDLFKSRLENALEQYSWLALALLTLVNGIFYFPSLTAFLISDDFTQIYYLHTHITDLLNFQGWREWFLGVLDGYLYFRPLTYAVTLNNFIAWNQAAFGYHLASLVLHNLACFLIFLLVWRWTRRQAIALCAALLFAIFPAHAEAVSWMAAITDLLCGTLFFLSILFFTLFREKRKRRLCFFSWITFLAALASKEVALVLPAAILAYDSLLNLKNNTRWLPWAMPHLPYWLLLGAYLLFRIFVLQTFGYGGTTLGLQDILRWFDGMLVKVFTPFPSDEPLFIWFVAVVVISLLYAFSKSRHVLTLSLVWIPITFLPTINALTGPSDRSFYVPSLGVCLALALCLMQWIDHAPKRLQWIGILALLIPCGVYGATLIDRNQRFHRAGEVAETILQSVKAAHPVLTDGSRLVFTGVPASLPGGPVVFLTGFSPAVQMMYPNPVHVLAFSKFPIWTDSPDTTFFFQVDHRRVVERKDVASALQARAQCDSVSAPILEWRFADSAFGWEPWNDLSPFDFRGDGLTTRSLGVDPNMASPLISIPAIAVGRVEITMRVASSAANPKGAVYWLATGQQDFSPDLGVSFQIIPDGEFHTYRGDIGASGMLLLGDEIIHLRLDPIDAPANITISAIRVFGHCVSVEAEHCICAP